ncbi:MAG: aminopeptidase P family protein [Nanoarchaeota archaeon]
MKIKELQKILSKKKTDFALFYNADYDKNEHNMVYFSQYKGIGVLVIPKDNFPFLIVPKMEQKSAKEGNIKRIIVWDKEKRLFENVKFIIKKNNVKIAIDKNNFSLNAYKELKKNFKLKTTDISKECDKLRQIKTKKEIEIIKKGCKISDEILTKCIKQIKTFKTESEIKAHLENETKKRGCELAFSTIVASGKNSSKAHHHTIDTKLNRGFCVIDFGIKYKDYCTDTTRTIYIGKITKKEKQIYDFLLKVQKDTIKSIKINDKCSKINEYARKSLKQYNKYFTHGLGHGFGIKIHELPNLTEKSKDVIQNNMVFTVEPGIYMKSFGIRIEDDILIEKNQVKILTRTRW